MDTFIMYESYTYEQNDLTSICVFYKHVLITYDSSAICSINSSNYVLGHEQML